MNQDRLAYLAFAAVFAVCVVFLVGFAAVAWLGFTLGILWGLAIVPLVVGVLTLLFRYSGLGRNRR